MVLGRQALPLWTDTNLGSARFFIVTAKGLMRHENEMKSATVSIINFSNKCSIHQGL